MRAGILAVGTELLGIDRLDSNSLLLNEQLQHFGVAVQRKSVVGDVAEDIATEISRMIEDFELVLVTGGLGPTSDDVTRQATARALGRRLRLDRDLVEDLRAKFRRFGRPMPEVNVRQAELIDGAQVLHNPRGTAPGMRIEHAGSTVFLFPGVPAELRGLIASGLEPWLREHTAGAGLETRILRVACIAESALEEKIRPAYEQFDANTISVLASPGDIQIRLTAGGAPGERRERLRAMTERLSELIGDALYSSGEQSSLEEVVGELLTRRKMTLATAESCTGGLVAERVTRVPGSSAYFLGGVVAYSDHQKEELLGVSADTLASCGAVSQEVVLEMATGVIGRLGADVGIAISGIAGPGGGTEDKPVGTVQLALAERETPATHRELHLPGDRQRVRWWASQVALDLLRRRLLAKETAA